MVQDRQVTMENVKRNTCCVPATILQVPPVKQGSVPQKSPQNKVTKPTKTYTEPLYYVADQIQGARL